MFMFQSFSLCSLEPYFVIVYIMCLWFCSVCGLRTLKHLVKTKTLKNILVDCLTSVCDLIWILGLKVDNIPELWRFLANAIIWDLFLANVIHMIKALRDSFDLSVIFSLCLNLLFWSYHFYLMLSLWVCSREFYMIHVKDIEDCLLGCLVIFIWYHLVFLLIYWMI
jgi:hypothetical protein